MKHKISIKQTFLDILSIKEQLLNHFKDDGKYDTLLTFISKKNYYNDDNIPIPTLKQIAIETGLKTHELRKQIKDIYATLFNTENNFSFNFKTTEVYFNINYLKRYASFKCNNLTHIPRIGENITLPFLRAKIGIDFFYVDGIRNSFEGDKHSIDIELKGGFFNSYWYFRKHKALEQGEIGLGEQYDLYEYQLKERVGLRN